MDIPHNLTEHTYRTSSAIHHYRSLATGEVRPFKLSSLEIAMRRRRRQAATTTSFECQLLEDRALLSATLEDGVLSIQGTAEDDVIRVGVSGEEDVANLVVRVNEDRWEFPVADVAEIDVNADAGNDSVRFGKRVPLGASVDAGDGNDKVIGTRHGDTLVGGAGRDKLVGAAGNDSMDGGEDGDRMNGGTGTDTMNGGGGRDHMVGHFGADVMFGGEDNDFMDGGRGDDVMAGENGDDVMRGNAGDDDMSGGAGNDHMGAGAGSDMLFGEDGDDTLGGNSETDILDGGTGDNTIRDRANGRGDGGRFDAVRRAKRIFTRIDANRDRVLTSDEVPEDRLAQLLEFDADESGDIVFREFFEWFKEKTGRGGGDSGE